MESLERQIAARAHPDRAAAARLLGVDPRSPALGRLTDLAARLMSTAAAPMAVQVSLLTDVQTIAAGTGLPAGVIGSTSTLADSLCSVTAAARGPVVIGDAIVDARVAALPPVTSGAVRSYLGVPLVTEGGAVVGALCAFGAGVRDWSPYDSALLEEIAGAVVAQLELQALTSEYEAGRLRWQLAIEAAEVGSFTWDLRSGEVKWDERMGALYGYPQATLVSHVDDGLRRVHPDDLSRLRQALDAAVGACSAFQVDHRVVWPDGQQRWLSARGRAIAGADGRAVSLLGTSHDVTALRSAGDEAARLLDTLTTGFVAVDSDWRVTYINLTGQRVLAMTPAEIVGRDLWEAFPGLEDLEFGQQYKLAAATGTTVELEAYYPHLDSWFEVRAIPDAGGLALHFMDVTARRADRARADAVASRLDLLAEVTAELAAAGLATPDAVARLAELVVPVLADWCVVTLVEAGQVHDVGSWHSDPEQRELVERYVAERLVDRRDLGAIQEVFVTRQSVVLPSGVTAQVVPTLGSQIAKEALIRLAPESAVVVPMVARGQIVGILTLCRGADRAAMSPDEVNTALEVAARAGLALDNARLYGEQRGLAEVLQRSLLTTPPAPDHCEIAVRYVPAAEVASVGGDWFDAFLQADGATVLVIGDVMGHDTVAAAAMGQVRSLLRGIAWHTGAAPAEVLSGLDAAMEGLEVTTTATAVVARIEQSRDERARDITRLRWSNAGHPPPMAMHPDGTVQALAGVAVDLLLGFDPATTRTESTVVLDRGSTVLLYTDGLVERRGQDLDEGLAMLARTLHDLRDLPLEDLCDGMLREMLPAVIDDDVALVAVRLHRQDRPRPAEAGPQRVPDNVPDDPGTP